MNGISSGVTVPPLSPRDFSDADLWEHLRARGLSPAEASQHVERRRQAFANRNLDVLPPPQRGKLEAFVGNAAQAITGGIGDEFVGASFAAMGPTHAQRQAAGPGAQFPLFDMNTYQQMRDQARQHIAESRVEHPFVSVGGTLAGAAMNPLTRLLGGATAGLSPTAQGAVAGTVLGGVQGLGEGTGTLRQRLPTSIGGAVAGGITGGIAGRLLGKLLPVANRIWRNLRGTKIPPAQLQPIAEDAIRKALTAQGHPPEAVEQVLGAWRAQAGPRGTALPDPNAPPPMPVAMRPGETITPISPRGFEVTGPRKTPPVPTQPTLAEMQGFTSRGVGGHSYTGTYPAGTATGAGRAAPSPMGGPGNSQAMQLQQLQHLVQLPPNEFEAVASLFPSEIIQQLRMVRAQLASGGLR